MSRFLIPPRSVRSTLRSPHQAKQRRRRGLRFERLEPRTLLAGHGDFNGDGFDDLAIGALFESVGGITDAGAVTVIYGSRKGLSATGHQFWHQDVPGVNGVAAVSDGFGSALAVGDFNDDGFDDLAIGVPRETVNGKDNAGAVNVLYGSKNGLRAGSVDQLWTQDSPGVNDKAEEFDQFGQALAAGDFNGDGRDDLAIGVPGEDFDEVMQAGMVNVLFGSTSGLSSANDQQWHQNSSGINGIAEAGDFFGSALAVGDFNGDGRDDLAIGNFREDVVTILDAGTVNVIYGSKTGLTGSGDQFWHQDSTGIPDDAEASDFFGRSLAVGDFNGDGRDDLAVGIPGENSNAGAVQILNGSANKLIATSSFFNSSNLGFAAGAGFGFGSSLATGDFDGDGIDDLAIGAPGETVSGQLRAGAVYARYGSNSGLTVAGAQRWTQATGNVLGISQANDFFGSALATGDYDGDRRADLAIGVPMDVIAGVQSGSVNVLYGFLPGLIDAGNQLWHQGLPLSASDGNESGDFFGFALA